MVRYVDLFCGMGSFTYSFHRLGFECALACDIDPTARRNFEHNFGLRPVGDITQLDAADVPDHDVLCAGFPCQPFSHAGRHDGFGDTRGTMFFHVLRIVERKRPRCVVLENVPALLTHDGGRTFRTIVAHLDGAGYAAEHAVLKCSDYGLPQQRRRLFIVAIARDAPPSAPVLDLQSYRGVTTLSDFFGRAFERPFAYTIRCGGRRSGLRDRHNWDTYVVDGAEHRLTLDEARRLQGFDEYELIGVETQRWKLLGNTIPTVFTRMIGERLAQVLA